MNSVTNPDAELARTLARLWPHRVHESSVLKNLLCVCGLHRRAQLDLRHHAPGRQIWFCRWCEKIWIDGISDRG